MSTAPTPPARRRAVPGPMPRDRHGRGLRGVLLPASVPRYRTRRQCFDHIVISSANSLLQRWPTLQQVEFATEDVPPSDPAPWESQGAVLGRYFAPDPPAGLRARIVLYRRPIETMCAGKAELAEVTHAVLVEQVASLLGRDPSDIDPNFN